MLTVPDNDAATLDVSTDSSVRWKNFCTKKPYHKIRSLKVTRIIIQLSKNNITLAGKQSQFKTYRQNTGDLPYDFHSIMHYSNTFFSKDGNVPTIQALIDSNMQLGLTDGFSALDVVRINMLYKCPQLRTDCKFDTDRCVNCLPWGEFFSSAVLSCA